MARGASVNQCFVIGDALPLSISLNPGIGEAAVVLERLATVSAFGAIRAGDNCRVSIDVNTGFAVGDFLGMEGRVFDPCQILSLV